MGARGLINGVARNDDKSTIQQKCMEKYIPPTLAAAVTLLMSSLKKNQTQILTQNILFHEFLLNSQFAIISSHIVKGHPEHHCKD